jgi:REP element-mobilizing transposase RayT
MTAPLYTSDTCPKPAYQLNWSYTLFWHAPPPNEAWLEPLKAATEPEGIRVLQHKLTQPRTSQFLISTKPSVSPLLVAQRVKGRLQHILRPGIRNAFQRNYALRSVGSANRLAIDAYIAGQLEHHPMADPRVADQFREYQFHDETVDLSQPCRTSHAIYWYNLHVVFVNDARYRDIDPKRNEKRCQVIRQTAAKKGHFLMRVGMLPDHVHFALRADLEVAPQDVVFPYMNNLAYVIGMKPVLTFSYYAGTFGEYDLTVIPQA